MKLKIAVPLIVAVLGVGQIKASASVIADWTFETSQPATAGPFSPETGAGSATGSHAGAAVYSTPAGNGSSHSFSSNTWAVGDYYQYQVSTTGLDDISIQFDQTSSNTGPRISNWPTAPTEPTLPRLAASTRSWPTPRRIRHGTPRPDRRSIPSARSAAHRLWMIRPTSTSACPTPTQSPPMAAQSPRPAPIAWTM